MGMEMVNGGMTPAEAVLLTDRRSCNDNGFFGGDGSWVFFLFFLLAVGATASVVATAVVAWLVRL